MGRLRAREITEERRRHPLPQLSGLDEGLLLRGGRRWDARARPRALGRAGSDVARAPPGLLSPPPPRWCARADTGRGGGVRGARVPAPRGAACVARCNGAKVSRLTGTRVRREHAVLKRPGGGEGKARERSGARAPPKGCSCLRVTLPRQAGLSREQVVEMPGLRRGGGGGSGRRPLGLEACTALH